MLFPTGALGRFALVLEPYNDIRWLVGGAPQGHRLVQPTKLCWLLADRGLGSLAEIARPGDPIQLLNVFIFLLFPICTRCHSSRCFFLPLFTGVTRWKNGRRGKMKNRHFKEMNSRSSKRRKVVYYSLTF